MSKEKPYEVWVTQGQGSVKVDEYRTLAAAKKKAEAGILNQDGSYGIKLPNGKWYDWGKSRR